LTVLAAPAFADPWRFEANPEVYVLVAFLVGAFVYMVRRIGPSAVSPGQTVVTRKQVVCFAVAMVVLFLGKSLIGGGTDNKQQPPDSGQPSRVIR